MKGAKEGYRISYFGGSWCYNDRKHVNKSNCAGKCRSINNVDIRACGISHDSCVVVIIELSSGEYLRWKYGLGIFGLNVIIQGDCREKKEEKTKDI